MAVSRVQLVETQFRSFLDNFEDVPSRSDLDNPVRNGATLTARETIAIFTAQLTSRNLDIISRELKARGESFYTIGSSGHEGNASVAAALRPTDPAFLHYRSGAFFLARAQQVPGPAGAMDVLLGMVASTDEPIAGGRHKVFGSVPLNIPPQTSTIASQLPKALGWAVALERKNRLLNTQDDSISVCTFGDASINHATATTTLNAAGWTRHQRVPAPVLFVCEDNGFGISVRTPQGWVAANNQQRHGVKYFFADGLDLVDAYEQARLAAAYVRTERAPALLHMRTVRLLGHAGSDVEQLYRTTKEIEASEAQDPLIQSARILMENGWMTKTQVKELHDQTYVRLSALAEEAVRRPKIRTAAEVIRPLYFEDAAVLKKGPRQAEPDQRLAHFKNLPEKSERLRHMAFQLNRGLSDLLLAYDNAIVFGEDVGRKGGVYHVTQGLTKAFGVGRVFNTLLDETMILGLAIGSGQAGLIPLPEVQYLAYLMNAIDQLRGEAGSMQFFSQGQYSNPMVLRIAAFAYQKGFGGHFHNDNGIAALREIPGILIGTPSRGDDGVRMLRTLMTSAAELGRVCVMLEPIALYMMKDLYESGDNKWLTTYPAPTEILEPGSVGVYGDGTQLCIMSYANGLWMSLRVAKKLEQQGISCRVIDIRWLQPLPLAALSEHAKACEKVLIVDECRKNSGIANEVSASLWETTENTRIARLQADDTYIPLGAAANLVLLQEEDIERAALQLLES